MLKAYLDWMGNVFPYMLISETMRIVVPREIEKKNVHEYHPRRVLVLRLLLHRCLFIPPAMPWLPSSPSERLGLPQGQLSTSLAQPAVFFFLGP